MAELRIEPHVQGAVLSVRAQPGARRNAIAGVHDGALRVSVAAAPEKGKANAAILEALSSALDVSKSSLEILSGSASRQKRVLVKGLTPSELERRLLIRLTNLEG